MYAFIKWGLITVFVVIYLAMFLLTCVDFGLVLDHPDVVVSDRMHIIDAIRIVDNLIKLQVVLFLAFIFLLLKPIFRSIIRR